MRCYLNAYEFTKYGDLGPVEISYGKICGR